MRRLYARGKRAALLGFLALVGVGAQGAQTNIHILAADGAWTWFNDPRALFHNGILYVGYVRNVDGRSALTAYDPHSGTSTRVFTSSWSQADDHNNPGLLPLHDGRLMAFYTRHSTAQTFAFRTSLATNPVEAADWGTERLVSAGANVTYANPYQLSAEGGRIYNFMRSLNFNPAFMTSDDGGTNWSAGKILIHAGTGGTRPYVKYASDYARRIDFLYTDGHPRNVTNSLYHAYYQNGGLYRSDGTFLKFLTNAPLLHDSGERGALIYRYSDVATTNPDEHIPGGRAWCHEVVYETNARPICVFSVQRDGAVWTEDRIYYYYARWTGTDWQKRFIAHAGRPLYNGENDYAGGICLDPEDPHVVYISSNAAQPFERANIGAVPLAANDRYELYRGRTDDGGLTFAWSPITTNSTVDNLRPYVPRRREGKPALVWFRGAYTSYTSYDCEVVALLTNKARLAPSVRITSPATPIVHLTNSGNKLKLSALVSGYEEPGTVTLRWTTSRGPTNAQFENAWSAETAVTFPLAGTYDLLAVVSGTAGSNQAAITVQAGALAALNPDALWLKLDEGAGNTATDSTGNANGSVFGGATWLTNGGQRAGALRLNGTNNMITVPGASNLDNTPAFTLAYWFHADAWPPNAAGLVSKREGAFALNAYTTYLDATSRRIFVDVDHHNASNDRFASAARINTGAWYHVALVFNGSLPANERVKLWLNGRLDTTAAETSSTVPFYGSQFRVGNMPTAGGLTNWFTGMMDDVRFHRRALSESELIALALTNTGPSVAIGDLPPITNGLPAMLAATVTDDGAGGMLTTWWSQVEGPGVASFAPASNNTTSVIFNKRGTYALELCASDSTAVVCLDLAIQVQPNRNVYEDWIDQAFPGVMDNAIVGLMADPDYDGQVNLIEFAFALNPSQADSSPLGILIGADSQMRLVSRQRVEPSRLTYWIESSQDLVLWEPADAWLSLESIERGEGREHETRIHRVLNNNTIFYFRAAVEQERDF